MKKSYLLEGFEPRNVLRHFEDICSIPHGTGHEAALRSHIIMLAEKNSLFHEQDQAGNLLVRVPASAGDEGAPPFLIQGHMDMVLAKEPWVERDLVTEPVELVLEGNILRADGTTLGADNAVGLCHMMALMETEETSALRHPPLELLFTVEEETGLTGIRKADLSRIRSRRMLNMDCGDPDCLVIGAAGSCKYDLSAGFPISPADGSLLCIEILGLRGGHSGIEAGKNRASALELGGRLLSALCDKIPVRLVSLESSPAAGGFPRWMKLMISVPSGPNPVMLSGSDAIETAEQVLSFQNDVFLRELAETEPGYQMKVTKIKTGSFVPASSLRVSLPQHAADRSGTLTSFHESENDEESLVPAASAEATRALADFLLLVPFDALRRDPGHPVRVLCSALLTGASFQEGTFRGLFSIRANRDFYRDAAISRLRALCRLTGITASLCSEPTPAWIERENSPLRSLCLEVYRDLYGEEMRVQVENGAVEVSVIQAAIPEMDAIGFAPRSRGAHTTDEHLDLETMPAFWSLLTALLCRLSNPSH